MFSDLSVLRTCTSQRKNYSTLCMRQNARHAKNQAYMFEQLVYRAWFEMQNRGANIWSISTSDNEYFMHCYGEIMRKKAKKFGALEDFTTKLGLIYGAPKIWC